MATGRKRSNARTLVAAVALAAALSVSGPSIALGCWTEYSDAEKAFREGFEFYLDGNWERAIDRMKDAKEARREADANCTVQVSDRRPAHKAYYLPRFYLGVASFEMFKEQGDEARACEEAMIFFGDSLRIGPGETRTIYERYRSRLRKEWAQLQGIQEICEGLGGVAPGSVAASSERSSSISGGGR